MASWLYSYTVWMVTECRFVATASWVLAILYMFGDMQHISYMCSLMHEYTVDTTVHVYIASWLLYGDSSAYIMPHAWL